MSRTIGSALTDDFLDTLQNGVAVHDRRRRVIEDPLLTDHTLRINQKERPVRGHYPLIENPISPDRLPFDKVTQQRVWQL